MGRRKSTKCAVQRDHPTAESDLTADVATTSKADPDDSLTPTTKRGCGRRSHASWSASTSCPVCGVTIRLSEAAAHFETEVTRLDEVAHLRTVKRAAITNPGSDYPSTEELRERRRLLWKRVRRNRSGRLTARTGPPHLRRPPPSVTCPVCCIPLDHLSEDEDRTRHVDHCLARSSNGSTSGGPADGDASATHVDVEIASSSGFGGRDDRSASSRASSSRGGELEASELIEGDNAAGGRIGQAPPFEEYEWAGQTRIRANSALYVNVIPRSNRTGQEEDGGDLDVEGDEMVVFGDTQFSEADLIPTSNDNSTQLIREAMLRTAGANDGTPSSHPSKWHTLEDLSRTDFLRPTADEGDASENVAGTSNGPSSPRMGSAAHNGHTPSSSIIIECLKAQIRELEKQTASSTGSRCLVCQQPFTNPLTSIVCWHVYCQDCWLKTLGCKKLCPLCNMITRPADLRRIYL